MRFIKKRFIKILLPCMILAIVSSTSCSKINSIVKYEFQNAVSKVLELMQIFSFESSAGFEDYKSSEEISVTEEAGRLQVNSFLEELTDVSYLEKLSVIPAYDSIPYTVVNANIPFFNESDLITEQFEYYSELDELSRCGVAVANICRETMPDEERGAIGHIKPTGWHTVKYPDIIKDNYLYNRCHLIGFQLTGENDNYKNLITGTRYMNVDGMLPFENMVADYVESTGNHVLYRVTPVYTANNLVADGVLMEGYSVEDNGKGICFNVFIYNVQPGIAIDYATGKSAVQ